MIAQASAEHLPLSDKSVDLVFGSPPYLKARHYGDKEKHARGCIAWVDWMLPIVKECCRVCKGLVLINCAGSTEKWNYQPGPEMLLSEWYKLGGQCWRPCYWNRVGIPGSGGRQWYRADVEYVLAFKAEPGPLAGWTDNTANGHPPKWAPGGEMSNRLSSGARVNQLGHPIDSGGTGGSIDDVSCGEPRPSHRIADPFRCGQNRHSNGKLKNNTSRLIKQQTRQKANGDRAEDGSYLMPAIANPGNVVKIIVGGGVMGHDLAHENEAPFPVDLPRFFIKSHCEPGGIILDPFGGSGSTGQAADEEGRRYICMDIRFSQCELMTRRLAREKSLFE